MVLLTLVLAWPVQQAVPALTGRVIDRADILSPATEEAITALLTVHEEATSNQVVVLTVFSLEGEAIEDLSIRVAETWELGTAQHDNGVLLLVAVEDRELRIEVGLGLEGDLTDVAASRIIRNEIVPVFRQGDFNAGVLVGVQSILGVLEGTYTPPEGSSSPSDEVPMVMRILFGVMFILMPLVAFVPSFFLGGQWGNLGFMGIFIVAGGFVFFFSVIGTILTAAAYVGLLLGAEAAFRRLGNWQEIRRKVDEALTENRGRRVTVNLGGFSFRAGGITSSSGSGGGWSGGGGFSGGGGSFGGGGSSGSW
ncbi:MAG: YgcG family protein [Rhodothermales bacterium]